MAQDNNDDPFAPRDQTMLLRPKPGTPDDGPGPRRPAPANLRRITSRLPQFPAAQPRARPDARRR